MLNAKIRSCLHANQQKSSGHATYHFVGLLGVSFFLTAAFFLLAGSFVGLAGVVGKVDAPSNAPPPPSMLNANWLKKREQIFKFRSSNGYKKNMICLYLLVTGPGLPDVALGPPSMLNAN